MYAGLYADRSDGDLRAYAVAAAGLAGLTVDEAWWSGVLRHLGALLVQADLVADGPGADGDACEQAG